MLPRRSKNRKPHLTQLQRELVIQAYAMCGSYAKTAEQIGIHPTTVQRIVHEADNDIALQQARFRALEALAGKAHSKADQVLDAITPDDLKTERIEVVDEDGQVRDVLRRGPTLRDKAFAFAQIADRVTALQQARQTSAHALSSVHVGAESGLLLPDTVEACRAMIAQKVQRLRILDVEFAENPRIQEIGRSAPEVAEEVVVGDAWFD